MSAPLSHTLNIKDNCEIYMAGGRVGRMLSSKLYLEPTIPALILSPFITEHLKTNSTAAICPMERFPAHLGNKRQEDIKEKRPSPIFNKIWCYFPPSVMPLLLQISLVVKGIDCEPERQLGLKRRKQRWRVWAVTGRGFV